MLKTVERLNRSEDNEMSHLLVDMHDGKINPVVGFPQEEIERMFRASLKVDRVLKYYSLGVSVTDAYHELVDWKPKSSIVNGNLLIRELHKAERLTRSYLFEFRTTLDYFETALKRDFGKDSNELKLFKEGVSDAYENTPEYAFTYQLRNCAQHCANIVHGFCGCSGSRISCNKNRLLQDFDGWKSANKAFIIGCPDDIDLIGVFIKTNNALNKALSPLIQHFLDENETYKWLWDLRCFGDALVKSFNKDVYAFHIMTPLLEDETEAMIEEWESGKVVSLNCTPVDWDSIYRLTDGLRKGQ